MTIFNYNIPIEIIYVLAVIFGVLTFCSFFFWLFSKRKKSSFFKELITRTNSWWFMAIGIAVVITAPKIIGTLIIAYISFVALREMFSIGRFRDADRTALFIAYFAIPIQFYLAYYNFYHAFLYFIPLVMFIGLPFILVMTGKTKYIGRSMSTIPSLLILTVYMLSHMVLLFNIDIPDFTVGAGGLIIFLITLTAFNDVFQFTWGKLLGKRNILPNISPNKTWAGFIGGTLTTAALGYFLRFLTPLTGQEALLIALVIGLMGFVGDSIISAIKRDLQIKDTDDIIPGHGGAMDRLDSIVLTTPVFYHLLIYFIEI